MKILNLFQKKGPVPRTYRNSPDRTGYFHMWVSNYGYPPAQKTLKALAKKNKEYRKDKTQPKYIFDIKKAKITLDPITVNGELAYHVLVDGGIVGTLFQSYDNNIEYFPAIIHGKVEAVHLSIEYDNINEKYKTRLYVKIP